MKRIVLVFTILIGLTASIISSVPARAQSFGGGDIVMTDEYIEKIKQNCIAAQSSLNRLLQNSDKPLRVNLGNTYDTLMNKLMIPMNNRMATSGFDTQQQVTVVTKFQRDITAFKAAVNDYYGSTTSAIAMNCRDQPVAFYDAVGVIQTKRQTINDAVKTIDGDITEYKSGFETFAKQFTAEKAE